MDGRPLRTWAVLMLVAVVAGTGCQTAADPPSERFGRVEPAGSMTVDRAVHQATLLLDGTVLITGGFRVGEVGLDSAELFDPATAEFRSPAAGPDRR